MCDPCDSPWVLYGALVGGPDETDCWNDDRANWEKNEVGLRLHVSQLSFTLAYPLRDLL